MRPFCRPRVTERGKPPLHGAASRRLAPHAPQRGLTLIELMISLAIGLVMTIALFGVILASESRKRVGTGLNDLEQAGNIAMYQLDQWVRSAGSGFGTIATYGYGCALRAKAAGGQTLPLTSALPAPFASVNPDGSGNFALAPLLILPGSSSGSATAQEASDTLVVMGGAAGLGGAQITMTQAPAATALTLNNTVAFNTTDPGDLLLVADQNGGSTTTLTPCMLTQVAAGSSATSLALGGSFHGATIGGRSLVDYTADAVGLPLGVPVDNPPQFLLIGVGANDTLFTYDLLNTGGSSAALQARSQGIYEMHALYGVDDDGNGTLDNWRSAANGAYAPANLLPGAVGANPLLRRIVAVRVSMVTRLPLPEKTAVSPASLTLFSDLAAQGLSLTRSLSADQRRYRYRVVEATLVLRNNLQL